MARKKKVQIKVEDLLWESSRAFLNSSFIIEGAITDKKYWGQFVLAQTIVQQLAALIKAEYEQAVPQPYSEPKAVEEGDDE
jgi:predicted amidophosphoribosyltransferase